MSNLEEIENEWKNGDRPTARRMAKEWAGKNRDELFPQFKEAVKVVRAARIDDDPSEGELVELVSAYRANGDLESARAVKAFIMGEYEPRKITGAARVVRGR